MNGKRYCRVRIEFTTRPQDWNQDTKDDIQSEIEGFGGDVVMTVIAKTRTKEWPKALGVKAQEGQV